MILSKKPKNQEFYTNIVISLTSYGKRLQTTTPITLASLLRQSVRVSKILVWLDEDTTIPKILNFFESYDVEFHYYNENIRSYKKLIPALEAFPDANIITVDDDIKYPDWWLTGIINAHKHYKDAIIIQRARKILVKKGAVQRYWQWPLINSSVRNTSQILPTGVGGILYPPNSLDAIVSNIDLAKQLAPHADDLWFWLAGELKGTKKIVLAEFTNMPPYELDKTSGLSKEENATDGNDTQLDKILERFPEIAKRLGVTTSNQK